MSAAIRFLLRPIPITAIPVRQWEIPCSRNWGTRREEPRKATKSRRQPRRGLPISVYSPVSSQKIVPGRPDRSQGGRSLSYETYDEQPKETPTIVAAIALDGADTVLMHWLGEVDIDDCAIGMPVEAVFAPKAQRTGSILDVKYFRPTGR